MIPSHSAPEPAERITLEDLTRRADAVRDLAVSDAKAAVAAIVETDTARKVLIVAGVVLFAASIAYFVGSRACRSRLDDL